DAEEWVIRAAYPEGKFEYEPELWHGLYWQAWEALRFDRFYGAFGGEGSISYMAIRAYAQDNGIVGDDFRRFHTFMTIIDMEWLKHAARKAKARGGSDGD